MSIVHDNRYHTLCPFVVPKQLLKGEAVELSGRRVDPLVVLGSDVFHCLGGLALPVQVDRLGIPEKMTLEAHKRDFISAYIPLILVDLQKLERCHDDDHRVRWCVRMKERKAGDA
jgi:hypothetical protein